MGRDGVELKRSSGIGDTIERVAPVRKSKKCLVCGDQAGEDLHVYKCVNKCNYFSHEVCVKVHAAVVNEDLYSRSEFKCETVLYQIRPDEIDDNIELEWDNLVKLSETLKLRGMVNTAKYNNKRKRWINDEIQCELCRKWYGVNEGGHSADLCRVAPGSPITDRNRPYPFAHLKRFRCMTYKVP